VTLLARVVFLLLVGATLSAFFVAQRLESAPRVVTLGRVMQHFSPNGDGRRDVNDISVRVTRDDQVTLSVIDDDGDEVRRLLTTVPAKAYRPVRTRWDGRGEAGARVPDGRYRLRVRLRRDGRSVDLPRTIRLDTTPPRPVVRSVEPPVLGPEPGPITIRVRGTNRRRGTRFRVLRTDGARTVEVARFGRREGWRARWDGWPAGTEPGTYLVVAEVMDRAGNIGTAPAVLPPEPGAVPGRPGVTLRRLAVAPPLRPVRSGEQATFFVDARRRAYEWSVRRVGQGRIVSRGRSRVGRPRLALRAPEGPSGAYLLQVRAGDATTRVPFLVQSPRRAPILVVAPAITWLGTDWVDDDRDGLPNTLLTRGPVTYPRVFARGDGLPAGFATQVAPLLAFLDRARLRYDVTTDLALAASRDPRASDRAGVLLPGALRWVPRPLARRLRRFVAAGGRLASVGADSLRRGVAVEPARLVRPTQPTPLDPFGARIAGLRRLGGAALEPLQEAPGVGLLTGVTGGLTGFTVAEELLPAGRGAGEVRVAVGRPAPLEAGEAAAAPPEPRPALTATRLGRGLVIRVGLPEWGARLDDPTVAQITRNIADLLRGVRPRLRSTP